MTQYGSLEMYVFDHSFLVNIRLITKISCEKVFYTFYLLFLSYLPLANHPGRKPHHLIATNLKRDY